MCKRDHHIQNKHRQEQRVKKGEKLLHEALSQHANNFNDTQLGDQYKRISTQDR